MGTLAYYLALPFLHGIALLPMRILYGLSDLLFVLVFHLVRYRRKVVRTNLRNSFPEKDARELATIERHFYRWFGDLVLETLKTLHITPALVDRLVQVEGTDVLRRYKEKGRSIIIVMGHWGNWELGGARFATLGLHQLNVIYHPLHDRHFNDLVIRMRTRLGNGLYPMTDTMKCMVRDRGKLTATAFIADQTPPPERAYWTTFLHQDTPVFWGTEKIAAKLGYPVVYCGIDRIARGRYRMRFEDLVPEPKDTPEGLISEAHTRRLEQDIRANPAIWLWTHRRWKHQRPALTPQGM
ncbi:MAG: lysophospholipid acyltransferase family protein [Flavobacteriales bacterium]|nr:lysophospholipid acyltransferase family protein [Flavobacteriales bacterium]MCB9165890.1 lysophospholipid acyltransferase family protein [Flavobacteriales bacterium]MCB9194558.1 lysophospholipid acyltransferase family protein [Flavobacteriales bacterium]